MARTLDEIGFYTLAGAPERPAALIDEVRDAERLGLGAVFISEPAVEGRDDPALRRPPRHLPAAAPRPPVRSRHPPRAGGVRPPEPPAGRPGVAVIMHGASPAELEPILPAYRALAG